MATEQGRNQVQRALLRPSMHEDSDTHILAIELEAERVSDPLQFSLQQQLLESMQDYHGEADEDGLR